MGTNDKGDDGIGNNNNNINNSHSNDKNDGAGNTDNTPNDTPTDDKKADSKEELDAAFEMIRSDAEAESKLKFSVEYEQDYYEIKSSGEYDDDDNWTNSVFIVNIVYDSNLAVNEDWYKGCPDTNTKTINAAFYECHKTNLSKGNYSNFDLPIMHLRYYYTEDFNSDYAYVKDLANLDYVTKITIIYRFGVPKDYILG